MSDSLRSPSGHRFSLPPAARRFLAVLLIGLTVVGVAYVASVGVTAALLPDCARCHMVAEFAETTDSGPHASVECASCHGGSGVATRLAFGNAQVLSMYLSVIDTDPTLADVPDSTCLSCHEGSMGAVVDSAGLTILHLTCAEGRACTECHSPTAHGHAVSWPRSATMEMCFDCHGGSGISDECSLCHSGRLASDRIQTGSFAVTHGPNYLETHGMGNMRTCAPCHEPERCAACHGAGLPHGADFMRAHSEHARSPEARCSSCHLDTFCTDCHGYEMPHPDAFLFDHATITAAEGEQGCRVCHSERDCTLCHEKHVHPTTLEQLEGLGVIPSEGSR